MTDTNRKISKRKDMKKEESMNKRSMYVDSAKNAMKNVSEFDAKIIESNDNYLGLLAQNDKIEYDILKENMMRAETESERQEIRKRLAEMKKERYAKDTENKQFYEMQQTSHKNYTLQVLTSVAVVTGLVHKYRKPIMDFGKKLITKE